MKGALALADHPAKLLRVACRRCDRRGQERPRRHRRGGRQPPLARLVAMAAVHVLQLAHRKEAASEAEEGHQDHH